MTLFNSDTLREDIGNKVYNLFKNLKSVEPIELDAFDTTQPITDMSNMF